MKELYEGLQYKDMVGVIKPTLYVDEFASKIADDDEIAVLSFYTTNAQVCDDLINWFEKGYEYIMDADKSPGEISPGRYLVYVEIARRTRLIAQIKELLEDLETLTEYKLKDWNITHDGVDTKYDAEALNKMIDLSPHKYRQNHEEELNEMRITAGLNVKPIYRTRKKDPDMDLFRSRAGLL